MELSEKTYNEYDKFLADLWKDLVPSQIDKKYYVTNFDPSKINHYLGLASIFTLAGVYQLEVHIHCNLKTLYWLKKRLGKNYKFHWARKENFTLAKKVDMEEWIGSKDQSKCKEIFLAYYKGLLRNDL